MLCLSTLSSACLSSRTPSVKPIDWRASTSPSIGPPPNQKHTHTHTHTYTYTHGEETCELTHFSGNRGQPLTQRLHPVGVRRTHLVILQQVVARRGALLVQVCQCEHAQPLCQLPPGHVTHAEDLTQLSQCLLVQSLTLSCTEDKRKILVQIPGEMPGTEPRGNSPQRACSWGESFCIEATEGKEATAERKDRQKGVVSPSLLVDGGVLMLCWLGLGLCLDSRRVLTWGTETRHCQIAVQTVHSRIRMSGIGLNAPWICSVCLTLRHLARSKGVCPVAGLLRVFTSFLSGESVCDVASACPPLPLSRSSSSCSSSEEDELEKRGSSFSRFLSAPEDIENKVYILHLFHSS